MSERPYQCPKAHRHATQRSAENCHICRRIKDAAVRRHFKAISKDILQRAEFGTGSYFRLTMVRDQRLCGGAYRVTGCFALSATLAKALNTVDTTAGHYLHMTSVRPWPVGSACNPRQVLEEVQARQAVVRAVNKVGSENNVIRHIVANDDLVVLTSSGEMKVVK